MAVAIEYARTRDDAEDIVQDAFRRVYEALDRFETTRSFRPWFFTILRNTARNAAKKERRMETDPPPAAVGPFEDARRAELRRSIVMAMDQLSPMQARCFRLCVIEGLTSAEASLALGVSESTVRVHVFHARRALQRMLEAWRGEVSSE